MSVSEIESGDDAELETALGDAHSILLLSSSPFGLDEVCSTLLSETDPTTDALLGVTLDETPDQLIDHLRAHVGSLPSETGVIAVGESTRSAAAASAGGPEITPVSVDTLADPSDLTGLAMAIGSHLDRWSAAETTPVVCFNSISSLLFHADEARVFRFLHSTTGRLNDVEARAHYHLDPAAYAESTVNAFSALFDAVVRVEDDGAVTVKTRR